MLPPFDAPKSPTEPNLTGTAYQPSALRPTSVKVAVVMLIAMGVFVMVSSIGFGSDATVRPGEGPNGLDLFAVSALTLIGLLMVTVAVMILRAKAWAHALAVVMMVNAGWNGIAGNLAAPESASWWGPVVSVTVLMALLRSNTREWCFDDKPTPPEVTFALTVLWSWIVGVLLAAPVSFFLADELREAGMTTEALEAIQQLSVAALVWSMGAVVLVAAVSWRSQWGRRLTVAFVGLTAAAALALGLTFASSITDIAATWTTAVPAVGWTIVVVLLLSSSAAREWCKLSVEPRQILTRNVRVLPMVLKRSGIVAVSIAAVVAVVIGFQSESVDSDRPHPVGTDQDETTPIWELAEEGRAPIDKATCDQFEFDQWERAASEFDLQSIQNQADAFEENETGSVRCSADMTSEDQTARSGEVVVEAVVETTDSAAQERSELMVEGYTIREPWTVYDHDRDGATTAFRAVAGDGQQVVVWFVADNLLFSAEGYLNRETGIDAEAEAALEDLLDQAYAFFEGYA